MASGLSDVLRDLAAGDPQQPAPSDEQPPAARVRAAKPTAKPRPANVADESGEIIADAPAAKPRQRPASARAPQRRKPQNTGMKMVAAPALLAVALLLLAIGIWGSLVLMGVGGAARPLEDELDGEATNPAHAKSPSPCKPAIPSPCACSAAQCFSSCKAAVVNGKR